MNEKSNQLNKNDIIEAYYKMIGEAHIKNILADLDLKQDKIKGLNTSKYLDQWLISFDKERTKKNNRIRFKNKIRKMPLKIVMSLFIVGVLMTATTFSVEAFRVKIFNFFLQKNETYTVIEKQESVNNQLIPNIDIDEFYYLAYLP